ncbi:hypothetical protein, partial [Burkholderia vietnamiensis]|uniref:hypothetical protein n=1 Tax=Burkholderia vietnamiensis TaxID=60552 RepID=UPI003F498B85
EAATEAEAEAATEAANRTDIEGQHHSQLRSSHIRTRTDLLGVFPRARGSIPLPLCTGRTLYARAHAGAPPPTLRRKTGPSY